MHIITQFIPNVNGTPKAKRTTEVYTVVSENPVPLKEIRSFREMARFRSRAGNIQNEPVSSHCTKKQGHDRRI